MLAHDSGYESAAESIASTVVVDALQRLVQEDLEDASETPPAYHQVDVAAAGLMAHPKVAGSCSSGCNGACTPCILFHAQLGCPRGDACQYCHIHDIGTDRVPHRPRKTLRHKIKRTIEELLGRFDTSPERVHDEIQELAAARHSERLCTQIFILLNAVFRGQPFCLELPRRRGFRCCNMPACNSLIFPNGCSFAGRVLGRPGRILG